MCAKLQQLMAAHKNHARCTKSIKKQLPARMKKQWKHCWIQSRRMSSSSCYRTLGFRLFPGQFVTSYQNADIKDNPTLALIAVLWQHSQKNSSTSWWEGRNSAHKTWEGLGKISLLEGHTWYALSLKALKLLSGLQEQVDQLTPTETKQGTCLSYGGRRVRDTTHGTKAASDKTHFSLTPFFPLSFLVHV